MKFYFPPKTIVWLFRITTLHWRIGGLLTGKEVTLWIELESKRFGIQKISGSPREVDDGIKRYVKQHGT